MESVLKKYQEGLGGHRNAQCPQQDVAGLALHRPAGGALAGWHGNQLLSQVQSSSRQLAGDSQGQPVDKARPLDFGGT